jgi:hypothetical protein
MAEGLSMEERRDQGAFANKVWEKMTRGIAGYVRVEEIKEEPVVSRYDIWDGAGDEEVAEAQLKSDIDTRGSSLESPEEEE